MGISYSDHSRDNGVLAVVAATLDKRRPPTPRGMQRASASRKSQIRNSKSQIGMTLALRQRHLRIFTGLSVLLPLLFVVGIAVRRAIPQTEALPAGLSPQTITFTATGYERDDLFDKSPVR